MPAKDTTKSVVQRFWDEIVSRGNPNVADGLSAPKGAFHDDRDGGFCDLKEPSGPAAVRELIEIIRNCFSDLTVAVEDQMDAEADRVVTRFAVSGTCNQSANGVWGHDFSS
jgi:hypothetical protein